MRFDHVPFRHSHHPPRLDFRLQIAAPRQTHRLLQRIHFGEFSHRQFALLEPQAGLLLQLLEQLRPALAQRQLHALIRRQKQALKRL